MSAPKPQRYPLAMARLLKAHGLVATPAASDLEIEQALRKVYCCRLADLREGKFTVEPRQVEAVLTARQLREARGL